MDHFNLLCDELLVEIIHRLPPAASAAVPLICKRWLRLHRSSKASLSLRLPPCATPRFLSDFLSLYPSVSSLSLLPDSASLVAVFSDTDALLLAVSASSSAVFLRNLRFLAGASSPVALLSLAASCKNLSSLCLSSLRSLSFRFLSAFPFLREFSVLDLKPLISVDDGDDGCPPAELPIEALCFSGIGQGDLGLGWLWRSCVNLKKLQLRSCEGTGDSFRYFAQALGRLREVELRTCRTIADRVLLLIAQHSNSLSSLLLYDGGSRDGLLWFISRAPPTLRRLDLRLPLDLEDDHLSAICNSHLNISSLKLQSCCLVTGVGLKSLAPAMGAALEELVLINCDAVEREPGLLTSLGQNLRALRKLDLSYNEMLIDKELGSMLASCCNLVEIRLRGCGGLTDSVVTSILRSCKQLEIIDVTHCRGIGLEGVESFVLKLPRLNRIMVEESKLTDAVKTLMTRKIITVG